MNDELSLGSQENILTLLCFDNEAAPIIISNIEVGLFSNPYYRNIAYKAITFYQEFDEVPKNHIADLLELEINDSKTGSIYAKMLGALFENAESVNKEYALKTLEKFVKEQSLKITITRAAEAIQSGRLEEAEHILEKGRKKTISTFDPGTFMFQDMTKSFSFFDTLDQESLIYTGIKQLDDLEVCPSPGELFIFVARSGAGKSWFLVHLSKYALLQRKKVLHISLELSEDRLKGRYFQSFFGLLNKSTNAPISSPVFEVDEDGTFSKVNYRELYGIKSLHERLIIPHLQKELSKFFQFQLVLKEFPTGTLSVDRLNAYLDNLESYHNFTPDIILLDYLDLMDIDAAKLRIDLGQTAVALRGIAGERKIAMVTVAQTNKSAEGRKLLTRKFLAEDFSKVRVADNLITYTQARSERKQGIARLFIDKARNAPDGSTIGITQNYAIGQFCISSARIKNDKYYWETIGGGEEDEE